MGYYKINTLELIIFILLKKQIINILVVWFLTGLWHGADWNFILWGLYFGVILLIEKLFLGKVLEKLPNFFRHLYALFLIAIGWIIFAVEDLGALGGFVKSLFISDFFIMKKEFCF